MFSFWEPLSSLFTIALVSPSTVPLCVSTVWYICSSFIGQWLYKDWNLTHKEAGSKHTSAKAASLMHYLNIRAVMRILRKTWILNCKTSHFQTWMSVRPNNIIVSSYVLTPSVASPANVLLASPSIRLPALVNTHMQRPDTSNILMFYNQIYTPSCMLHDLKSDSTLILYTFYIMNAHLFCLCHFSYFLPVQLVIGHWSTFLSYHYRLCANALWLISHWSY